MKASAETGYMTIAALDPSEKEALVSILSTGRPALAKLVEYLASNPYSTSSKLSLYCEIGNISQEATAANKKLFGKGYMVGCMRPPVPLKNKFEQEKPQNLWALYKLPEENSVGGQ